MGDSSVEGAGAAGPATSRVDRIAELPGDWHQAGNLTDEVVRRMDTLIREGFPSGLNASAETGCGKSTLLLSCYSKRHLCFTLGVKDNDDSLTKVQESELLVSDRVEFIIGPSQITLQNHKWDCFLDFALIDGAHAYPFPELDYLRFYPQLNSNAILAVDDIHIPTISHLYAFLREDDMFDFIALEGFTAFFRRTAAPSFYPFGDGWWKQKYNQNRFPFKDQLSGVLGENWWLKECAKRVVAIITRAASIRGARSRTGPVK
jgi:Methyltransferase domain